MTVLRRQVSSMRSPRMKRVLRRVRWCLMALKSELGAWRVRNVAAGVEVGDVGVECGWVLCW